ncbi:uncharacterized protein [Nicotiana tomentosiformis]|uniref:uncharacterized protein isoform X1 n=1 Tax=Nicotiana tomentosiformis TaxID=4098 RepID=UPI00388CC71A
MELVQDLLLGMLELHLHVYLAKTPADLIATPVQAEGKEFEDVDVLGRGEEAKNGRVFGIEDIAGKVHETQDKSGSTAARYVGINDEFSDDKLERKAAACLATAGVIKSTATLGKPTALVSTAVQAGQLLSPGKTGDVFYGNSVTAPLQTVTSQKSDVQAMQKSNEREWAVVNRSPNKKNAPAPKHKAPINRTQSTTSNNQVDQELASTSTVSKSPGSGKH